MNTPTQEAPAVPEQVPQAPQPTPEQPPTPQQPSPAAPTPPAVSPEEIANLRAQAQKAAQLEESYNNLRADYTRKAQALAQLAGSQEPAKPQDPLAPYVAELVQQGYSEADARAVAGVSHKMLQPIMQQLQQQQAAVQNTNAVQYVMQQAWGKNAAAFSDPEILQSVEQALRQEALRGNQVDAEYALDLAFVAAGRRAMQQTANPGQQPQRQAVNAPQFSNGMFGVNNGFNGHAPQQTSQQAIPAHLKALQEQTAADVANRFKFQPRQ